MHPKKRMSVDELLQFPGYEQISDEKAEETIQCLEGLAELFISLYQTKREVLERVIRDKKNRSHQPKTIILNSKSKNDDHASAA